MKSIKNRLKNLFSRKKATQQIIITFVSKGDGTTASSLHVDKGVPVTYAMTALDRVKQQISVGLAHRCSEAGYKVSDPKRRNFIAKQTLGDVMR